MFVYCCHRHFHIILEGCKLQQYEMIFRLPQYFSFYFIFLALTLLALLFSMPAARLRVSVVFIIPSSDGDDFKIPWLVCRSRNRRERTKNLVFP